MSRDFCRLLLPVICIVTLAVAARGADEGVYKIRLNGMDLGFDRQTGSLVSLSYPATGVVLEAPRERAGLLDVAFPIDAFTPLRLASRFSAAEVAPAGDGVTIRWKVLGPSRANFPLPEGQVSAQVTVRPADDGRSVILSCRIANHSKAPIPQVLFPDFWGLTPSNGVEGTELRLAGGVIHPFTAPFRQPETTPFYALGGWTEYRGNHGYYGENSLRWLDFGGLSGGISVFQRKWATQDHPDVMTYRAELDPMHLRLAWEQKDAIDPGQTWESGEFWLTPHPGGWAKGIEVYRRYVEQVNPARSTPAHILNGLGFRTIWMIQGPEKDPQKAYFRFTDIPRAAQDTFQYGLDELVPWNWSYGFALPIPYIKLLGTKQELMQSIQQAKALGVNVAPFVSFHIILDRDLARYGVKPGPKVMPDEVVESGNYTYHTELIPEFQPYYDHEWRGAFIDDDNPVWQHDAQSALTEWVNRGMTSLAFDQFCYKETPGQKPGLIKVIEQVRALARSMDPQSTFGGESCVDLELDNSILDYTWDWTDYRDAGPIVSVLRWPRLNCNIGESPLAAKRCFAEGLYLNLMPGKPDQANSTALIGERPLLAQSVQRLAALRKQFLPYFVQGNALGESILSQSTTAFVRAYRWRNKLLVFVLNDRPDAQYVVFNSDLSLWLPPSSSFDLKYFDEQGRLLRNSSVAGTRWLGVTDLLPPGEIAVFELQAK